MPDSNPLRQPDEQLLNELQSKLCDALVLLDHLKRKVQADASEEWAGRDRLARLAIARMQAERVNSRVLRMDRELVQAFGRLLLDPKNSYRQAADILREELGQKVPRMTAHRFATRFRDTAESLDKIGSADGSKAVGGADPAA